MGCQWRAQIRLDSAMSRQLHEQGCIIRGQHQPVVLAPEPHVPPPSDQIAHIHQDVLRHRVFRKLDERCGHTFCRQASCRGIPQRQWRNAVGMDVLRAFFQFGKGANSRASRFVEGVVHFQQQCMIALDNQRIVWLKAMQVVHERSSSLSLKYVVRVCIEPSGTHRTGQYPGVYQKRGTREGFSGGEDAPRLGKGTSPLLSHLYAAKSCSDTLSNTVCCTAGGNAAMPLVRQASTVVPKTPCSLMNASSSGAALAVNSRAMACVATAVCGYFRSTKANARAIFSMGWMEKRSKTFSWASLAA